MRRINRILAALLCAALMLSPALMPTGSAADLLPTVKVCSATGAPGQTVSVNLTLSGNPGITTMVLDVSFDESVLTLQQVTDADKLGAQLHSDKYRSPYRLTWANDLSTTNFSGSGRIVTLTFAVSADAAAGDYPISVTCGDIYNADMEDVLFVTQDGSVTVASGSVTAAVVPDGVSVRIEPSNQLSYSLGFCVVYDENGQFLGFQTMRSTTGAETVVIPCNPNRAHTVRAFFLNGTWCAVCEALSGSVTS
ncbi:MAG: hypothetical protein IKS66_04815 [Oscillospiraceae bacterium]|nr:hypothetical protein [Oscillospiraceae bacterium]